MDQTSVGRLLSVNVGKEQPNPVPERLNTGIFKRSVTQEVEVRAPGPRGDGPGSGLVGDFIGDSAHHGGDHQAVYAFAREELDHWESVLGRQVADGTFGENLTTTGYDVDSAVLGEVWRIGEVRLQVSAARTPCQTFAGVMREQGWIKDFTRRARTGAYLRVLSGGFIRAGMEFVVESRPEHGITVAQSFSAATLDRAQLTRLLETSEQLHPKLLEKLQRAMARD